MHFTTCQKQYSQTMTHKKILYLTTTALCSALICISTAYLFHIPIGSNQGYIHVGDAIIYLAASLLPTPYAMAAAGIGGAMADLLTAPVWAPATFLIKMLNVLPFTYKKEKLLCTRNVIGLFLSGCITFIGYFLAEGFLFGTWAALVPALLSGWIQPLGSAAVFLVLAAALDKIHFKTKIFH